MNRPFVVDSSVVVKWIVQEEPPGSSASQLKDLFKKGERTFVIPDLLFYEVGNVLLRKFTDSEKAEEELSALWRLPWLLMPLRVSLLTRTQNLASFFNLTFYDALFLATAERARADLITADLKLLAKIKRVPFAKHLDGEFLKN